MSKLQLSRTEGRNLQTLDVDCVLDENVVPSVPASAAKAVSLPIQKCKVSFVDRRGVYHAVNVQAATVFEAVCRASAIFKQSVVEDPTWAAEFIVEIREQPKLYRVKTDQMKKWLSRNGSSPRELMEKKRLREMLAGSR